MKAYLFVLNTLADWEIGYITAELNSGRYLDKAKDPPLLVKIGTTTAPIKTMGGITITPDDRIDNVKFNEGDLLLLPGAETWMDEDNMKVMNLIPDILNRKVVIAAICGATMALANAGILNDRKHTSNDKDFLKMTCPRYTGEDYYVNLPAVTDDNLITATGLAPLEFSYEVFKKTLVMRTETLEAWYKLFKTGEAKYYFDLMGSLG